MNLGSVDSNLDNVSGTRLGAVGNLCGKLLLIALQVQIDLSAHKLGNFNVTLNNAAGHCIDSLLVIVNALGTDAHNDFLAHIVLQNGVVSLFGRKLNGGVAEVQEHFAVILFKLAVNKVHLRSADKACNEQVDRHIVQILRSIHLLNKTVLHNNDSGCHGHSLGLVMGNVNKGGTDSLMDLGKLGSHGCTELCVKV